MIYNKLVRDRIPEIIRQKGNTPIIHIASEAEYPQKLKEKLQEEVAEFIADDDIEELADILEVVYALCEHKHICWSELEALRKNKAETRGGFKEKIILERLGIFNHSTETTKPKDL